MDSKLIFIVFYSVTFMTVSLYTIIYDTNNNHSDSDSKELITKNNDEIIALWTLMGLLVAMVIILCTLFIVNHKVKTIESIDRIPHIVSICVGILSIVATGISWDYFGSRYRDPEKNIFMTLTLVQIISLLYLSS